MKAAVLAALVLPGIGLAVQWGAGALQPRPLEEIIHATGLWGIRFLLLSLCLTPIRQESRYADLVLVRRMIGVGAFAWLFVHLGFYVADQAFDLGLVLREVLGRFYLTLGAIALIVLAALAATSTDGMVKRLGARRWRGLHRLVYGAGVLAIVHFFMQSKADPGEATVAAGLYCWAMLRRAVPGLGLAGIALAAVTAMIGAGVAEAAFLFFLRNIEPARVLAANLDFAFGPRPAVWAGIIVLVAEVLFSLRRRAALRVRGGSGSAPSRPADSAA
ncbi:ferric reductase-like transmembrane domain-containing protein [Zavarzinia compransoris]|nr:ferric reductase-like transmembrane domain-containing protein [Zavarzinia marina]